MTDRSPTQTSFLGGEWSPSAQGRIDHPDYVRAVNVSENGFPQEEGSWARRGGTAYVGPTYNGNPGIVRTWYIATAGQDPTTAQCVNIELSYGSSGGSRIQVWQWPYTNNTPVYSLNGPYASLFETMNVQTIATDIGVYFLSKTKEPWILTYDGSVFLFRAAGFYDLDGPYLDPLPGASQTKNSLGTVSATGPGAITFTITDAAYAFTAGDVGRAIRLWNQPVAWNSAFAYVAGDVVTYDGNFWVALTGVPVGNIPGTQVGIGGFVVVPWALVPQQANWAYGWITAVAGAACSVTLSTSLPHAVAYAPGNGANSVVIDTWTLGVYHVANYPACGTFHEGRLWLGGAVPGRIDASMVGQLPVNPGTGNIIGNNGGAFGPLFSPSDQYGTVADNSGISYQFSADGTNMPLWMIPEQQGIVMGTPSGEWLVSASNLNDPLTPTSIQCHRATKYGCAQTKAVRVGVAIAFIQTFRRRLMELVSDVYSGRFIGRHLNEFSKQIAVTRFSEASYQEEPTPTIWTCDQVGFLNSCTYRRVSHNGQEDPKFSAWSRQYITGKTTNDSGSRWVVSCTDSSFYLGSQSTTMFLTSGTTAANSFSGCQLEFLMPPKEPGVPNWTSWYLDGAQSGSFAGSLGVIDIGTVGVSFTISGVNTYLRGQTVHVYMCGLDFGLWPVSAGGAIGPIPYASDADGLGTAAFVLGYQSAASVNANWPITGTPSWFGGATGYVPLVVGLPYTSIMQPLRPATAPAVGGETGAAFGKTRRLNMWGAIFADTVNNGLSITCDANIGRNNATNSLGNGPVTFYPVAFRSKRGDVFYTNQLFSGVFQDTIECDYSFDGMPTLRQTKPGPLTIDAITSFMDVSDR